MGAGRKIGLTKIQAMFMETFGLSRAVSLSAILLISLVTIFAVFWFFHSAPPDTITITSGPEGSIFQTNAEKIRQDTGTQWREVEDPSLPRLAGKSQEAA